MYGGKVQNSNNITKLHQTIITASDNGITMLQAGTHFILTVLK